MNLFNFQAIFSQIVSVEEVFWYTFEVPSDLLIIIRLESDCAVNLYKCWEYEKKLNTLLSPKAILVHVLL